MTSFLLYAFASFILVACTEEPSQQTIKISGPTMGTTYHLTIVTDTSKTVDSNQLKAAVDGRLNVINQSMSTYIEDSELMVFNRAPINTWVSVSPDLLAVLSMSKDVYSLSNGGFDVTVGPLVELWGFGSRESDDTIPDPQEIDEARKMIGSDKFTLDLAQSLVIKYATVRLDLSAIAKGYAVDQVSSLLKAKGYNNFLVEIGGEMQLSGLNPRRTPWRIGIERPESNTLDQIAQQAISLTDMGVATSGDYRNYFEQNGKRYSHTINPVTGWPIDHTTVSVTVLDISTAKADALATALNVIGAEKGLPIAEKLGIPVYFLVKAEEGYVEHHTQAFTTYLQ